MKGLGTRLARPEEAIFVVRRNLVSVSCWVVACISTLELEGSGGMLPQEIFEIYRLTETASESNFNKHTLASQDINIQ